MVSSVSLSEINPILRKVESSVLKQTLLLVMEENNLSWDKQVLANVVDFFGDTDSQVVKNGTHGTVIFV